uniref:Uncharacterized protein n=1 Tax=Plectus sambesii TaxID=2011161 RepID=A0A914UWE8_9BILA
MYEYDGSYDELKQNKGRYKVDWMCIIKGGKYKANSANLHFAYRYGLGGRTAVGSHDDRRTVRKRRRGHLPRRLRRSARARWMDVDESIAICIDSPERSLSKPVGHGRRKDSRATAAENRIDSLAALATEQPHAVDGV